MTAAAAAAAVPPDPAWTRDRAEPAAVEVLRRAVRAATHTPYAGVQFVAGWAPDGATSRLVEVRHRPGVGTTVRVHGTADGGGGALFTEDPARSRGASPLADLDLLTARYELSVGPADRVAGRRATVVTVDRPSGGAAARLWVDDETGLLLRREAYDETGRILRASAFVDLRAGEAQDVPGGDLRESSPSAGPSARRLADLRARGWVCPRRLAGGDLALRDVRQRSDGRRGGAGDPAELGSTSGEVLHLRYSDGLWSVSVFQQRGRLDPSGLVGFRRTRVAGVEVWADRRLPQRLVWSTGDSVVTVVADAPVAMVDEVVRGLPRESPPDDDVGSRLRRGLGRMASWFDPFD